MSKKIDIIINKGKSNSVSIGKKEKRKIVHAEQRPDFEEKTLELVNSLNGTNFKTFQELPRAVIQIPIDLEKNGVPIGKLHNQAHYWIANDDYKKARTILKSAGLSSLQAKFYVKDEIILQKRNPEEREKYRNKPMPEEFKLLSDILN